MEALEQNDGSLKSFLKSIEDQKERAALRLEERGTSCWNFGILGAGFDFEELDLGEGYFIRKVEDSPGMVVLASVLEDKSVLGLVDRYASGIRFELSIPSEFGGDGQGPFTFAWWLISAIRIRSGVDLLIPLASSVSWSAMAAAKPGSAKIKVIEDVPQARKFGTESVIDTESVSWAAENLTRFVTLLETPAFELAVNLFTTHQHQANLRMVAASLWSAIEPLFDVSQELTFRVAAYASTLLEAPGEERLRQYQKIKKLYGIRSKAVHGRTISDKDLNAHVVEVRNLLRLMFLKIIEMGRLPTCDEFDSALMKGTWQ